MTALKQAEDRSANETNDDATNMVHPDALKCLMSRLTHLKNA